jgi:predicted LPLAT superfamily acyltransferase
MPEWQGKSRGTKLGYRIFIAVSRTFGLKPAYFLLRIVSLYYFLFLGKATARIYEYFRVRHGFGKWKSWISVYRNYYVFGQTLLDKMVVMAGIKSQFTYHFDGEENLSAIVAQNRGGMLISGHVGNWEIAGHFLQRLNSRVNIVMFDGEHRQIKHYLDQLTGSKTFNVIVVREDLSHVYEIANALQRNELICMHADRFLHGNKTASFQFLGDEALFPMGPFMLAAGFNVPVSYVFAFKETAKHYHFFGSKPILKNEDENKTAYTTRLAKIFVEELEQKVRMYPLQWFNYYNFWAKS